MHKSFYASGFLFHPPTQQILLQQLTNSSAHWSLFGGEGLDTETPELTFQRIVHANLHLKLAVRSIIQVYDYFHKELGKNHVIVYARIEKLKDFSKKNSSLAWFTRQQLHKLHLSEQTRQDITVGHRVIDAKERKHLGLHTLE